ncbi:MAG: methylmalonyl-CoA mutase [Chlamydiae bacterium]|nr:methylmalonyl-CoA mutase [Chlamydiota bacterium]MBI3265461.1 methylmalonyl-CoA mutase [Chlamydiota bacterium]
MEEKKAPDYHTYSNIPLKSFYDEKDFDSKKEKPGEYPFTRGLSSLGYRSQMWTFRQFAGFGSAKDSNRRLKYLLKRGQTGLSIAFDLPTLLGLDSDHPQSHGEVGKDGVAIDSIEDMLELFKGIRLEQISTSMTVNAPASIIWAMFLAVAEKQGASFKRIRGTIQNDILKEYIAQNTYIFPVEPGLRLIGDMIEFAAKEVPRWYPISISGYHIREAGATAIQELAFTLSDAKRYLNLGLERGLKVDDFANRLSFFLNAHNDFFEEIAKYRAARRLWAKILKTEYGAQEEKTLLLRLHVQTAGCSLTSVQPENNLTRTALQALAGVLGGTQSLHTNSMDEALALPTQKAVTLALRTQQIIAHESNVTSVTDPLGGSYYVEWLTDKIERGVLDYFDRIQSIGGVEEGIRQGWFQKEIAESAFQYQKDIEEKRRIIVGVNQYQETKIPRMKILTVDPKVEKIQKEKLRKLKKSRHNAAVEQNLKRIQKAASSKENLIPLFLEAVKARATLGEIVRTLKEVFGEYTA